MRRLVCIAKFWFPLIIPNRRNTLCKLHLIWSKIASRMSGVLGDSLDVNAVPEPEDERTKEIERIERLVAPLVGDTQNVVIDVVKGSPHDAITVYADEGDYDCIVMGHRGMGAVRGMLGSVCYSVLHKTNVPVLVVK